MLDKLTLVHLYARRFDGYSKGPVKGPTEIMSPLAQIVITVTLLIFSLALWLVSYTYGEIIPTLAIIEDPTATAFISLKTEDLDSKQGDISQEEVLVVRNRPITSSLRKVLHHLRSRGGRLAPWRGLSMHLVTGMATGFTAQVLSKFIPKSVAVILAVVLCARLNLAWNHIVISEPSPKYWFRRIPAWKSWVKVAPATALYAVATQIVMVLPAKLARFHILFGMLDDIKGPEGPNEEQKRAILAQFVQSTSIAFVVGTILSVLILIPATVTLTRVQASMLPETEETIVPFDRSFGGKVVPEIVGGSGMIGLLDAWKTFSWESRIRLLKIYFKAYVIQIALCVLFTITLSVEIVHLVPDSVKILKNVRDGKGPLHGI